MHTCNPSSLGGKDRWISEFEASLVYRVSSRTARATQRNPASKKQKTNKQTKKKETSQSNTFIPISEQNHDKTDFRVT